jgi:competence protein ComEA
MLQKYALIAVALGVAALAIWHPARGPALVATSSSPAPDDAPALAGAHGRRGALRSQAQAPSSDVVVYVAGAVRQPGLYRLGPGDRYDRAVALVGGLRSDAQPGGVNLAQRAADGDEIYVAAAGEAAPRAHPAARAARRRSSPPPEGSVDVNAASADRLAAVPGIGRAIAARIVELRAREGDFASLDELLDVAGMTASRLDRARPYLRGP